MNYLRPQRREQDLLHFANATHSQLAYCYGQDLKPGATVEDFFSDIVAVIDEMDDSSIDEPIEIVMAVLTDDERAKGPDWISNSPYCSLIVSSAFCLRALRAARAGDMNLAWSYMSDARYWCAISVSSKRGSMTHARRQ